MELVIDILNLIVSILIVIIPGVLVFKFLNRYVYSDSDNIVIILASVIFSLYFSISVMLYIIIGISQFELHKGIDDYVYDNIITFIGRSLP